MICYCLETFFAHDRVDAVQIVADPAWREAVLPGALEQAAAFSARICLLEGAFGHGIVIPETIKGRVMPR